MQSIRITSRQPPSRIKSFHIWAGAPSCYLELLDKIQRWICKIVCLSLAVSLEALAHHQNVASLTFSYRHYFGRCSSELAQLVPLVFHTWAYGRLRELQSNLSGKKLHATNQGSNFLESTFNNRDNVRPQTQFRKESQPQHLKR